MHVAIYNDMYIYIYIYIYLFYIIIFGGRKKGRGQDTREYPLNAPHATAANRSKRKERKRGTVAQRSYRQDDMYVRDFTSMYSDVCSKSTVKDICICVCIHIYVYAYIYMCMYTYIYMCVCILHIYMYAYI